MHLDVQDIRNFYGRSRLGRAARSVLRGKLAEFWPEAKSQTVAGFGYAVPFLHPYAEGARRVVALMPAPQGGCRWPAEGPNASVLCEETAWPLETGHVDKLLVVHGLETSERPGELLDECWRVLGPGGSALFVVPNRVGLWSRSDATPFGFGRPYSQFQLEGQLRSHGFMPERHATTLFQPPSDARFWRRSAAMWERLGGRLSVIGAGGVLLVMAGKRVLAGGDGRRANPLPLPLPELAIGPKAKPAEPQPQRVAPPRRTKP